MTQEEKDLLLKDLCARLPYGLWIDDGYVLAIHIDYSDVHFENYFNGILNGDVKPYLRPMSSMTEKEQRYIWDTYGPSPLLADFEDVGDVSELFGYCIMNISKAPSFTDWLNAHHFDYRGLIEKDLALEAPKEMYKTVL